jgi:hypothetical protein
MNNFAENRQKLYGYCKERGLSAVAIIKIMERCYKLMEVKEWNQLKPDLQNLIANYKRELMRKRGK